MRGRLDSTSSCPHCGGRLRLVALIDQAAVIQRILRHLGLPTDVPQPRPARAPPRPLTPTEDHSQEAPEFDAAAFPLPCPADLPNIDRRERPAASCALPDREALVRNRERAIF